MTRDRFAVWLGCFVYTLSFETGPNPLSQTSTGESNLRFLRHRIHRCMALNLSTLQLKRKLLEKFRIALLLFSRSNQGSVGWTRVIIRRDFLIQQRKRSMFPPKPFSCSPSFHRWIAFLLFLFFAWPASASAQDSISFNRDIRPILANHCLACHGPDEHERQADLRLDQRESALEMEAIVPGDPDNSSLLERVSTDDSDLVMPPMETGKPLSPDQKQKLKQWIAAGATYDAHWAFVPPESIAPPHVDSSWPRNGIDAFVLDELTANGLKPNQSADAFALVRRVYLDLIGLPPTIEQADAFVYSSDPMAYEKLVDQLLASKHYGERWALPWLDLARYSDTNGYEKDRERSVWPYRDWVIRALNQDMPYDQFSIAQLAGDMLENPTPDDLVATGFHRNTMLNEEGGIDPLEYRYLAMVDRVATTGTVWMGLTTGCAQCHTHKYDPITHTDYFRLMALLNNADEPDYRIPNPQRVREIETAEEALARLETELASQLEPPADDESIDDHPLRFNRARDQWIQNAAKKAIPWDVIRPVEMKSNLPRLELLNDGSVFVTGDTTKRDVFDLAFDVTPDDHPIQAIRLEAIPDPRLPDMGPGVTYYEGRKGDFFVSEIQATFDGQPIKFSTASHDFSESTESDPKSSAMNVFDGDGSTGWSPGNHKRMRLKLVMNLKEPIRDSGRLKINLLFERHYTACLGRFRLSTTNHSDAQANQLEETVEDLLATRFQASDRRHPNGHPDWQPEELATLERAFLLSTPLLKEARKNIESQRAAMPRLDQTLVMKERPPENPRETFRHHRGEYLNPREQVSPGIPQMFADDLSSDQLPANRLELAQWLVSDANPLAARVAVNRAWREFFGFGLVRTNGDLGVQSEPPDHPELLDWLASQFKNEMGWSQKKLHRLIVTSNTYRQSSIAPASVRQLDPDNRRLSRGPEFRLAGETVRDIALQASGMISDKMFGPGVRPPQPASVTALAYGATKWTPASGEDRYRRSIYTFKKRTAPFAAYTVFDGPTSESCTPRRNRSNTPLQALTTLNDSMYFELAQAMAKSLAQPRADIDESTDPVSLETAVTKVFRSFLTRPPTPQELGALLQFYEDQLTRFTEGQLDTDPIGGPSSTPEQAALTMLIRAVMNLDETITKR